LAAAGTQVKAGHIYPFRKSENLPKFGLRVEFALDWRNGVVVATSAYVPLACDAPSSPHFAPTPITEVEAALNKGGVTVLYDGLSRAFTWLVLDPTLNDQPLVRVVC
jgi:hypothetical protein